jgi:hypothetical protein
MKIKSNQYSNNDFIKALDTNKKVHVITAHFKNGQKVEYTIDILDMLKDEKDITCITDNETGEIIWEKEGKKS